MTEAGLNVLRRPPAAGGEGARAVMCGGLKWSMSITLIKYRYN